MLSTIDKVPTFTLDKSFSCKIYPYGEIKHTCMFFIIREIDMHDHVCMNMNMNDPKLNQNDPDKIFLIHRENLLKN